MERYPLLDTLQLPTDVRRLPLKQLPALAAELRDFLHHGIATRPDRLPTALSNVELAVALHHVFDMRIDRLVWDGGCEAWPHEVLTCRGENWLGNRPPAPRHPFIQRSDCGFHTCPPGHASTAIGAALGMAVGAARLGEPRRVVAVVTDSALTGGTTFEALNHAGSLPADLLVILNDTGSALSGNSGTLSNHLARVLSGPVYAQLRHHGKKVLRQMPTMRELARRSELHLKGMVLPGTIFEELGFNYIGPLDGRNVRALVATLRNLKRLRGPQFLHVLTGRADDRASARQAPAAAGASAARARDGFSEVFGQWLCEAAAVDPQIIGITADLRRTPSLAAFAQRFTERWFDVSIAQQHAVTFAAGLAAAGFRPIVSISSSCLQRSYDQLIHDVALQRLPVTFAVDHAGLVGGDDATQHGSHDLSYLRCIPNFTLMVPADENECREMLSTARALSGPAVVRYPCGQRRRVPLAFSASVLQTGRGQLRREGRSGVALLVFGALLDAAADAAERMDATLVNMRFVKPLDRELVVGLCANHRALVTIEENVIAGGAGTGVAELLATHAMRVPLLRLGIPDRFVEGGTRASCLAAARLDAAGLSEQIERWRMAQSPGRLRAGARR